MFKPILYQAALFFSSDFQLKPLILAGKIAEKLSSIFTVEPSTVNYPPNLPVPLEVPRIILQGDPNGQLTVSPVRADIIFNSQTNPDIEQALSQYISDFADCFESVQIIRLGFVLQFNLIGKNILSAVRDRYISPGKMNGSTELYVGWINKLQVSDIQSNRLINFTCNSVPLPDGSGSLIVDTNTIPEITLDLKSKEIKKYVDECFQQYRGNISDFIEW